MPSGLAFYSAIAAAAIALQVGALRWVGVDRLDSPLSFQGDALHFLAMAKAIAEQGWWWQVDRLGAPFTLDLRLFPVDTLIDAIGFRFLSFFTEDPVRIVNAYWTATFALSALAAAWSLRRLGIARPVALAGGLLFAFLPGALYRATSHLMLVYFAVPPAIAMGMLLLRGEWHGLSRAHKAGFWGALVVLGMAYVYYAFFVCAAFCAVAILAAASGTGKRDARVAIGAIALVASVSFLQLLPSLVAWRADPAAAANVSQKAVMEADYYALKLRHLLTPREDHPIAPLRKIALGLRDAGFPLENENAYARLGLVGSLGFVLLLGVGLLRLVDRRPAPGIAAPLAPAAALTFWFLLLATIGGLGSLFNYFVSPSIRTYNRISPLLGFLSLYALCWALAAWHSRISSAWAKRGFALGLGALVLFGIFDSSSFGRVAAAWKSDQSLYGETREFVTNLERTVPRGAMVYQLPYTPYPHTPKRGDMQPHQHLGAYVVSSTLRLSWPALSGEGIRFNESLANIEDPAILARRLAAAGFEGVILDRTGLDGRGDQLSRRLLDIGAPNSLTSSRGRFAYHSFAALRRNAVATQSPVGLAQLRNEVLSPSFSLPAAPLPEDGFRATIRADGSPLVLVPGQNAYVDVTLTNDGRVAWNAGGDGRNAFRISHRWQGSRLKDGPFDSRFRLFKDVAPGGSIEVGIPVTAPAVADRYVLEIDLVQEGVTWFSEKGNQRAVRKVEVAAKAGP